MVRLVLTEAGRAQSMAIEDEMVADVAKRLAHYPADQVAELERGLALLERVLADLGQDGGDAAGLTLSVNGSKD